MEKDTLSDDLADFSACKDHLSDDLADFSACKDHEREQRKEAQDDLEFAKLGKQWDERDIAQRKEDGRPCLTINKCPSFIKQVVNDGRINKPAIAVKPVGDGATKETADIMSDLARNIETQSQAPIVYDTAFDFAVSCGIGYFRVDVDYTSNDAFAQDICLKRIINPFSIYGDYESKEATSIDWNRAFVTDWLSKSAFEQRWGKGRATSSFEADDDNRDWFDDKRIRIAERWVRDEVTAKLLKLSDPSGTVIMESEYLRQLDFYLGQGIQPIGERETKTYQVKQRIITGSEILEENEWLGQYIPLVPMYGEEVNVNGKRHFISLIRRSKDAQRMVNYWRTMATELVALAPKAPWVGAVGQFDTHRARWDTANRVSHSTLEYDPVNGAGPPERQGFAGVPAGALQEALNASDDMKAIMGLYDASLGARSNETSGVAINARKTEGDTGTFNFLDNRNRAVEHGGRIILDLIPKIYSAERVLRCIQEDGSTYHVPVNQPVAPQEQVQQVMQQPPQGPPMMGPMGGPMPGQAPGMPPQGMPQQSMPPQPGMPPQGQQGPVGQLPSGPPQYVPVTPEMMQQLPPGQAEQMRAIVKVFDLTTGKYDVVVSAGPAFNTRRQEAAEQMMDFIRQVPGAAPLVGDLIAKSLDWPYSDQFAERIKAMLPPQVQGQNPQLQQAEEAINQLKQQLGQLNQQLQDKQADMALKQQELQIKGIEAQGKAQESQFMAQELQLKGQELALKSRELDLKAQEMAQPAPPPEPPSAVDMAEVDIKRKQLELDAYGKETERIKVMGTVLTPEQVQSLAAQTVAQALITQITAPAVNAGADVIEDGAEPPEGAELPEPGEGPEEESVMTTSVVAKPKALSPLAGMLAEHRNGIAQMLQQHVAAQAATPPKQTVMQVKKQPDGSYIAIKTEG